MRRRWPALAATIPLVLSWAVLAAHPASAAAAPGGGRNGQIIRSTQNTVVTSRNWAGYVAVGANGAFTSASANWTEPDGHCTGGGGKYAAFWVGLDGYSSPTVEQIGTEVDCSGFRPRYYAWYEIFPGAVLNFPVTTNPVSPGDRFSGLVTSPSPGTFNLVLTDITKHWTKWVTSSLADAELSSAEVIAEAPGTFNGGVLPLTNFGTVSFSSATVDGRPIAAHNPTRLVMHDTSVSAMTSGGNFSVGD
jgi:hypothetical protein